VAGPCRTIPTKKAVLTTSNVLCFRKQVKPAGVNKRLKVAVLGTGNIGTDLLIKILRSPVLECRLFAGRNLSSHGIMVAEERNVPVSAESVESILELKDEISLVFDATSALDHMKHAPLLKEAGIAAVDLTPAKLGKMCVPAVNLEECLEFEDVNMVTCGGQASIPLAYAIAKANPGVEYIEEISSVASRSAGPATRINLDEYLETTEHAVCDFCQCDRSKAMVILNPAEPCIPMQTTVMAKIANPDLDETRVKVAEMVDRIAEYVPGYRLVMEPFVENGRLVTMVRVEGLGDYLPKYAGNLDIINCAALAFAEAKARLKLDGIHPAS
jgi:acetaldehyde dehydrogenase